jgi:CDP-diacylglycerol--glycerol-3-phosphate 3-phosphatidyltransferase
VREIGITVWRFVQLSDRVIPASRGGKLKTLAQSVAISLALLPFPNLLGDWMNWVNAVFMAIALVLTVVTGIDYLVQAWRLNRTPKSAA